MTEQPPLSHPATKDLDREDPAPMEAKLNGYPWLPRMIDKVRASQARTLGDYYRYPCPIDTACLDVLGIDADTFRDIANRISDDQQLIDALEKNGARLELLTRFDPIRLNAQLHDTSSEFSPRRVSDL